MKEIKSPIVIGIALAVMAITGCDKKLHQKMAAEVFEALKKQEGTVKCGDIYGKYHFDHCDGCNLCAIQKVIEVLYNNGDIQTSTAQPWASAATPLQDR